MKITVKTLFWIAAIVALGSMCLQEVWAWWFQ